MAGTTRSAGGRSGRGVRRGGIVTFRDIVGGGPAMERVLRLARKSAASGIPVLIEGEPGVGKELLARAIHGSGRRRSKPFVAVECGAMSGEPGESEVLGPGTFAEARSGTLFLDGIDALPPDAQARLLDALREGAIDVAGGPATAAAGVRLISAARRNLLQEVRDGRFREDLHWRLNVFPIFVPPLRDRRGDIPGLVRLFMARAAAGEGRASRVNAISEGALSMLQACAWPGNVTQLGDAVSRAVALCGADVLTEVDFPGIRAPADAAAGLGRGAGGTGKEGAAGPAKTGARAFGWLRALDELGNPRALADVEADMIRLALAHCGGRMSEVARRLGIGRSTLYRKLAEHGIDPAEGHS